MAETSLNIRIGGENSGALAAIRGVEEAVGGVQKTAEGFGSAVKGSAEGFFYVAEAAKKVAAVAKGVFDSLIGDAVNAAEQIGELAEKTGIGVESLQKLKFAAEQNDTSIQQVAGGIKFLNRNLAEAARGGSKELAAAFAQVGISADDLKSGSVNAEAALQKIADVMGNEAIPQTEKTALLMKLLGRSGNELLPMMKNLANGGFKKLGDEAERLGAVMSDKTVRATKAFNDNLAAMQTAFKGIGMTILGEVAPYLEDFSERIREHLPAAMDVVRASVRAVVDFLERLWVKIEPVGAAVARFFEVVWEKGERLFRSLNAGQSLWDSLTDRMLTNAEVTSGILTTALDVLTDTMGWVLDGIQGIVDVGQTLYDMASEMLVPIFEEVASAAEYLAKDALGWLTDSFGDLGSLIPDWLSDLWEVPPTMDEIGGAFADLAKRVLEFGADARSGIATFVENVKHGFRIAAIYVVEFVESLGGMVDGAVAWLGALGTAFINGFIDLGEIVAAGGKGILAAWDAIWTGADPFEAFMGEIDAGLSEIGKRAQETAREFDRASQKMSDAFGDVGESLAGEQAAYDAAIEAIGRQRDAEVSATNDMVDEIRRRTGERRKERAEVERAAKAARGLAAPPPGGVSGSGSDTLMHDPVVGKSAIEWSAKAMVYGAILPGLPNEYSAGGIYGGRRNAAGDIIGGSFAGLAGAQGSLVGRTGADAGINFTEIKKFGSQLERDQFVERMKFEDQYANRRTELERTFRGKELRMQLDALDKTHREELKKLREKQREAGKSGLTAEGKAAQEAAAAASKQAAADKAQAIDVGKEATVQGFKAAGMADKSDLAKMFADLAREICKCVSHCSCDCGG